MRYRAYLKGETVGDGAENYAAWRRTIPWSNEEIADALERGPVSVNPCAGARARSMAAYLRKTGHLSSAMTAAAMATLVTRCCICGKTAHYRRGVEGLCSAHRDAPTIAGQIMDEKSRGKAQLYREAAVARARIDKIKAWHAAAKCKGRP
jgi:hypothetical protein